MKDFKLAIVAFVPKAAARRLIFLFPNRVAQMPWAGRLEGRHALTEPQQWEDLDTGRSGAKTTKKHAFGHSLRSMATTNGFTAHLKWSSKCQMVANDELVCVQLFHSRGMEVLIRVAPITRDITTSRRADLFELQLRPKCIRLTLGRRKFNFLRKDITFQAWAVFQADVWKWDQVVTEGSDGQLVANTYVKTDAYTPEWLEAEVDLDTLAETDIRRKIRRP